MPDDFESSNSFNEKNNYIMDRGRILENLKSLNNELKLVDVRGEIALVGGAVMCLVMKTRESTHDIDAIFEPKAIMYECIKKVACKLGLPDDWINDSVKGFVSQEADFQLHLELSNLNVFVASPEYMLAMKCLSSRADNNAELSDIRHLILYLNLKTYEEVETVMLKYYPISRFQVKTRYVIREVLDGLYS